MRNLTKRAAPPSPAAEVLAELDKRLASLEQRDRALLSEQLELEGAGIVAKPPGSMPQAKRHADAEAMLDGEAPAPASAPAEIRLFEIVHQRDTIARAIELGRQRGFRLRVAAAAEITGDIEEAWRVNIAATAARVIELQQLAQERIRLREEWSTRTGALPDGFPCGGQADRVIGAAIVGDVAYVFLQSARAAGIVR
jgi:hypothetical protein